MPNLTLLLLLLCFSGCATDPALAARKRPNVLFILMYLNLGEGLRSDVDLILEGGGGANLPPLSFNPMTGAPDRTARSITLQIFSAWVSERDPPKTVKSWEKTYTSRPLIRPYPVTTPSPGTT